MRCRFVTLGLLLVVALNAASAPKRRIVAHPPLPDVSTPAGWLSAYAFPLATTEATGSLDDLAPFAAMAGSSSILGLGDGTHGTHEYETTKLRLIQFAATRMGVDTLAMEGSFPQMQRVNDFVQGGPTPFREAIYPRQGEAPYDFWETLEFEAVATWMRDYNLARGDKPPIAIVGIDVWDGVTAGADLVTYLQRVDPAAASSAASTYTCLAKPNAACVNDTKAIETAVAAKEPQYTASSSALEYTLALHDATVAWQYAVGVGPTARNEGMARNAIWARDHRSAAHRILLWAHGEHLTRTTGIEGVKPTGAWLADLAGNDYFVIGNAMWAGKFYASTVDGKGHGTFALAAAGPDAYETFFHASLSPAFLLSLRGPLHAFLAAPHPFRTAGFSPPTFDYVVDLSKKFDAILYVDQTTPTTPLSGAQ